ncbi:MAG: DUF3298 domain-containing protein [Bacillota bacterium]
MITLETAVIVSDRKIQNERMNIIFPVIQRVPDPHAQNKINEKIQDTVYKMIWNEGFEKESQFSAEGNYRITLNQNRVLSLVLEFTILLPDPPELQTRLKSFTFNLKTGDVYKFSDLFKYSSNFQERLAKLIKRQIIERNLVLNKKFKDIDSDEKFYLSPDAVVIYYQAGEYAPGVVEFAINLDELKDLIFNKGPLAKI